MVFDRSPFCTTPRNRSSARGAATLLSSRCVVGTRNRARCRQSNLTSVVLRPLIRGARNEAKFMHGVGRCGGGGASGDGLNVGCARAVAARPASASARGRRASAGWCAPRRAPARARQAAACASVFHRRSHAGVAGVYAGAPFFASPWWHHHDPFFHERLFYPPLLAPVQVREEPMVYIEQPLQAAPEPQHWFYCEDSKAYFPYVQSCATPWLRVIPHAPQ